jgi:hypothetical protein
VAAALRERCVSGLSVAASVGVLWPALLIGGTVLPGLAAAQAAGGQAGHTAGSAGAPLRADEAYPLGGAYPGTPSVQQRNQLLQDGDGQVHVLTVRQGDQYPQPESSIYMLIGAGGNITVQVGENGILVVNAGKASMSAQVLAALHSLSHAPLRTIVDTDIDADDAGGNQALAATGAAVTGGDVTLVPGSGAGLTTIIAAQSVLDRMSTPGSHDLQPDGAWPTDTYTAPQKDLWFNGESVRIVHIPSAHTDGDSMVYFRHSDVVSAGNLYSTTNYPVYDPSRGGSIQGVIAGLDRLIYDIMIPGPQNDGGTLVIPNHGYLSSFSDVVFYQEMIIIVRDRIQHMIDRGMTLAQVLAARPTLDYDGRYGSASGSWTPDQFVSAVYRDLAGSSRSAYGRGGKR